MLFTAQLWNQTQKWCAITLFQFQRQIWPCLETTNSWTSPRQVYHIYPFVNSSHLHNCHQALTAPSSSTTYKSSPRLLPEPYVSLTISLVEVGFQLLLSRCFPLCRICVDAVRWNPRQSSCKGRCWPTWRMLPLWLDMPCFPSVSCWRTSGPRWLMLCDDLNSLCWTAVTCWTAAWWQRGICVNGRRTGPINDPTRVRPTWVFEGFTLQRLIR